MRYCSPWQGTWGKGTLCPYSYTSSVKLWPCWLREVIKEAGCISSIMDYCCSYGDLKFLVFVFFFFPCIASGKFSSTLRIFFVFLLFTSFGCLNGKHMNSKTNLNSYSRSHLPNLDFFPPQKNTWLRWSKILKAAKLYVRCIC